MEGFNEQWRETRHVDGRGVGDVVGRDGYADRTMAELFGDFATESQRLIRAETERARIELTHEAKRAARGSAYLGAGGVFAHAALLCLCAAAILGLSVVMHPAWAALLVTLAVGVVAGGLAASGRAALREVKAPALREQIREDGLWLKQTTRSVKASRHASA